MEKQSWLSHMDVILPGVIMAFKILIATILAIGGSLCSIIIWLGKQVNKKVDGMDSKMNGMDAKLDAMHHVIISCDGCSDSLQKYGRRSEDFKSAER